MKVVPSKIVTVVSCWFIKKEPAVFVRPDEIELIPPDELETVELIEVARPHDASPKANNMKSKSCSGFFIWVPGYYVGGCPKRSEFDALPSARCLSCLRHASFAFGTSYFLLHRCAHSKESNQRKELQLALDSSDAHRALPGDSFRFMSLWLA